MLGTIARVALLRVLPKRLIPLLTAWQVVRMLRDRRSHHPGNPKVTDGTTRNSRRR